MPLMLDHMRAEFARFLADDPAGRFRMDRALAHVITLAYQHGLKDGQALRESPSTLLTWLIEHPVHHDP